ncbi:hypothetical protein C0Q70_14603 [Pomacea canaliculata]|uniref:Uncharacterized protein n=1 Tax=Pomacea canaliculata TaxID=400727 RepID=A0A2T7NSL3_POMCA|nr:hypothetical protein C0Q70_14603 [Pomacea canaliculata]
MMSEVKVYSERARDVVAYGGVGLALALALAHETGVVRVLCDPDTRQPLTAQQVADKAKLKERYVRELLGALTTSGMVQLAAGTGGVRYGSQLFHILEQWAANDGALVEAVLTESPELAEKLERGAQVVEFGCGSGKLMQRLAAQFPASIFLLTDCMPDPLKRVQQLVRDAGLNNVQTQVADLCDLTPDTKNRFDFAMVKDVIHDLPYPQRALNGITQSLRPGGIFVMMDQMLNDSLADNIDNKNAIFNFCAGTFLCVPEGCQQPGSEVIGPTWGQAHARPMLEAAGLRVLKVIRLQEFESLGIYINQKPDVERDV